MTDLRTAAQQALKSMEKATGFMYDSVYRGLNKSIEDLKDALAEPVQEPPCATKECMPSECPNCEDHADELTVAYMMGASARRRLTDAEVGEVWFAAKIPGLTETQARLLIRAAERRLAGEK